MRTIFCVNIKIIIEPSTVIPSFIIGNTGPNHALRLATTATFSVKQINASTGGSPDQIMLAYLDRNPDQVTSSCPSSFEAELLTTRWTYVSPPALPQKQDIPKSPQSVLFHQSISIAS